jgi:hypothetical protein
LEGCLHHKPENQLSEVSADPALSQNERIEREKIIIEAGVLLMTLSFLILQVPELRAHLPNLPVAVTSSSILFATSVIAAVLALFWPPGSPLANWLAYFEGTAFILGLVLFLSELVMMTYATPETGPPVLQDALGMVIGAGAIAAIALILRKYGSKSRIHS